MSDEPQSGAGRALADFYFLPIILAAGVAFVFTGFLHGLIGCAVIGLVFGCITAIRSWSTWRDFGQGINAIEFLFYWSWRGVAAVAGWGILTCGLGSLIRWIF